MTTSPTPSTPIAQTQNQSVSSTTPSEAVRVATKNSAFWFRWYVGWAVIAVLVSVFLTWMVWRSGNLLQDAAVADANKAAGEANEAAGKANERAAKLEKEAAEARLELAKIDPINLPIKSMRVDVFLLIRGVFDSNFAVDAKPSPKLASFSLSTKEGTILGLSSQQLESDATFFSRQGDANRANGPNARRISLSCFWPGNEFIDAQISQGERRYWIDRENISTARLDKESYSGVLSIFGVNDGSEIVSGSCTVVINGAIRRTFSVPKRVENGLIIFNPIKETSLK